MGSKLIQRGVYKATFLINDLYEGDEAFWGLDTADQCYLESELFHSPNRRRQGRTSNYDAESLKTKCLTCDTVSKDMES